MEASRKMGRPTIFKKGPLTPAERQRRHRKKLRKEKRAAEVIATRERNRARFDDPERQSRITERRAADVAAHNAKMEKWTALYWQPPLSDANGPADELARQIAEFMAECHGDITITDVRAAIDRRFGPA